MASKKGKEKIAEKLIALNPNVPTSTRSGKTRKAPAPQAGKRAATPQPAPAVKKQAPRRTIKAEQTAPPKVKPTPTAPVKAAVPGMEAMQTQVEKSMRLPWVMIDVWQGVAQAYYGLAESQVNFLVNMSSWRTRF